MRQFKILGAALAAALLVAACGGSDDDAVVQAPAIKYTSLVSFGDSLSDVGTYKVGTVAALGGGTFSVNGLTGAIPSKNWTELIAAQIGVAAPCPAQTGLNGDPSKGFSIPVVNHPECTNYAQGGARVTDPVGSSSAAAPVNSPLGLLTVPVVTQIANHLGRVGSFSGTELVTVSAGPNDVFRLLEDLEAKATAAGTAAGGAAFVASLTSQLAADATAPNAAADISSAFIQAKQAGASDQTAVLAAFQAAAKDGSALALDALTKAARGDFSGISAVTSVATSKANAAGAAAGAAYAQKNGAAEAVLPMGEAGKQLANYIKSQIVGKGARYVAVLNMPDISTTPEFNAQTPEIRGLVLNMVIWFNDVLAYELQGVAGIRFVDVFTVSRNQIADPASAGLTNVTGTACNLTSPSPNPLGSSLVCNASNLNPGDVSHYLFADSVHPTPYGYKLLSDLVTTNLRQAGWLL